MNTARWQTIEEIFNQTLALPKPDRGQYLDTACQNDPTLRTEVDLLLKEVEEPDEFLSTSTFTLGAHLLMHAPTLGLQGQTLDEYKILKPLGRGGMGDVFLAEDPRLERLVAIKLLPPSLVRNSESASRFHQEARAASAISHPSIAHIYEFGHVDDRDFLVMEYVEGRTLRELLKSSAIDFERAIDIALQVANAMQAAHEAGIVHRDIKPENIMIRRDGYVKVLDFGLAKITTVRGSDSPQRKPTSPDTTPGLIMGTTAYMSPEQVRGRPVDARTDIWSLSVMLFEMIAGSQPFSGDTPSDVAAAVLLKEPAPFSNSHLTETEASSLALIFRRGLQKDRAERYSSIAEFIGDLKQLRHEMEQGFHSSLPLWSTTTSKHSLPPTLAFQHTAANQRLVTNLQRYWFERTRAFRLTMIASAVLLIALTIVLAGPMRGRLFGRTQNTVPTVSTAATTKIESLAILPFSNQTGDDKLNYLALGLADDLIRNVGRSGAFPVISLNSTKRINGRSYDEIKQRLHVGSLLEGSVKREGNALVIETRLVDLNRSQPVWQDKLTAPETDLLKLRNALALLLTNKLQERSGAEKHLVFAEYPTANNEAYRLYLNAKFNRDKSSVAEFKELIKTLEGAIALDSRYTLAYVALAENYNLLGTFLGQSPAYFQPKAKATLEKALAIDSSLADAHTLLAKIKMDYEHDWLGAEHEFKRAIELNPADELAHHWYGEVYLSAMGRLDESIAELETAHRLNPLSSGILTGLAWSHIGKGDYGKAIDECNQAFAANPDDTGIYEYRGKAYFKQGRFEEAIADAKKSFDLDPNARYLATLAVFQALSGKQEEARAILKRLQTDKTIGEVSKYDLAIVYAALGERDQAFRLLNEEVRSNSVDLLSIRIDPLLDELRDDPRFAQLEKRFNFPPQEKT